MKLMYPRTDSSRFDTTLDVLQRAAIDESLRIKDVIIKRCSAALLSFRYPSQDLRRI